MQSTVNRRKKARKPGPVHGMGSILHKDGVFFRVWAPHAEQVYVTGEFNDWSESANQMTHEDNGYWGINIPHAKAGQQYKFVLQTVSGILHRNDPYAKQLTHSAGNSIITDSSFEWSDDGFKMPAWNQLVIYEMHVGTFNRKDKNVPGTFYDVIEKLDYLKKLGINAIEIMPATEFPGEISWGYNPSHPFAIDSDYGGVAGFKQLVNEAHQRGIAVILDVVYNHFGPGDLDLWRFDGWSENEGGGIYFFQDWKKQTPWGDSRPDYGRPEVRQYIRDNALMWLDEYHVDGLRTDALAYIYNVTGTNNKEDDIPEGWTLMQWVNKEVRERFPWKIMIAEDLNSNEWITKPEEDGGEGFNSQWDPAFVHPVRQALSVTEDNHRNIPAVADAVNKYYNGDAFQRIIYTESHDEVANGKTRVTEEIAPGAADNWFARKRSILGAVLTFTSPGIPMIFQGQEMLENGWFSDNEPLDWSKADSFKGIVRLYRDLIRLRKGEESIARGLSGQHTEIMLADDEKKLLVYHRRSDGGPGDSTVVILNFSNQAYDQVVVPFPAEGNWKVCFNSDWKGYDPEFNDTEVFDTNTYHSDAGEHGFPVTLSIAPYHALIFAQNKEE